MNSDAILKMLLPLVASLASKQGDTDIQAILQQLMGMVDEGTPDPTPEQEKEVADAALSLYERIKNA